MAGGSQSRLFIARIGSGEPLAECERANATTHMARLGLFYVRFMDDVLVLAPTRWKLRRAVSSALPAAADILDKAGNVSS